VSQAKFIVLIIICTFMLAVGQTLWKIGLRDGFSLNLPGILGLVRSPAIWGGFVLFGLATLIWFVVLARLPLSLAYPFMSLSYVFGLLAAKYIFQETIGTARWLGVLLICLGVALVGRQKG
jgi:drug/metabolite transporter (DMT)-like permease